METMNELAALGGSGTPTSKADEIDYKAKLEEAERQLQSERVEAGRLKKAMDENAELRRKLAELSLEKRTESALDGLDESIKDNIPEDYQRGAAKIAQAMVDQSMSPVLERLKELDAQKAMNEEHAKQQREADFTNRINANYPGFLASIGAGGDKHAAWNQYVRNNAETIKSAVARCDFEVLSYHISNFFTNFLGVSTPSGYQDETTSEPRAFGSGIGSQNFDTGNDKFYRVSEYQKIMEKAQDDFQKNLITREKYASICEELSNAYKQGRVRPD